MFDLRYHVASLAAVFVALVIGILVGVAMSGKVDDAEKHALKSDVNRLRGPAQRGDRGPRQGLARAHGPARVHQERVSDADRGPAPREARRGSVRRPGRPRGQAADRAGGLGLRRGCADAAPRAQGSDRPDEPRRAPRRRSGPVQDGGARRPRPRVCARARARRRHARLGRAHVAARRGEGRELPQAGGRSRSSHGR